MKATGRSFCASAIVAIAVCNSGCASRGISSAERYAIARQAYNAAVESMIELTEAGAWKPDDDERRAALRLITSGDAILDEWGAAIDEGRQYDTPELALRIVAELVEMLAEAEREAGDDGDA